MPYQPLPPLTLNVDLGELADEPPALAALAGMVNVACGGHAGDAASMAAVIARAPGRIAAHPGYPDRAGFGRRALAMPAEAVREAVRSQCAALAAVAAAAGRRVDAVKPHGALYHAADRDPALARAVVAGARAALGDDLTVVGPPWGALWEAAMAAGLDYAREAFADRGVGPDGRLIPRGQPGAMITDPAAAAARAVALAGEGWVDTVCVHGDTPGAVAVATAVAAALAALPGGGRPAEESGGPTHRVTLSAGAGALPAGGELVGTDVELVRFALPPAVGDDGSAPTRPAPRPPREHVVRVRYDGADLAAIAAFAGVDPDALVARHAAAPWTVRFVGFLPGFGYLERADWTLVMPRRATPRPRVPAGAVGLAGARCGVYPAASPGGWALLGTALGPLGVDPVAGSLLLAGDTVRFVPA